jgi:kynurenine formamidase
MCSPKVLAHVQKQLGKRVSRRDLFKTAALAGTTSALLGSQSAHADGHMEMGLSFSNLVDLTHTVHADIPVWPGTTRPGFNTVVTVENDGFYSRDWMVGEHTGTHMDAPAHFIAEGATADALELSNFIVPIAVIDISEKAAADPDAAVTVADIEAYEAEHGTLPAGAMVLMYSGWEERFGDESAYQNMDADSVMHFPGFSGEAADFLIAERDITGVGTDTLSLDPGADPTFSTHVTVLGAGGYGLENVANLSTIPAAGAHLIVGILKMQDASGGPVRLMAAWG